MQSPKRTWACSSVPSPPPSRSACVCVCVRARARARTFRARHTCARYVCTRQQFWKASGLARVPRPARGTRTPHPSNPFSGAAGKPPQPCVPPRARRGPAMVVCAVKPIPAKENSLKGGTIVWGWTLPPMFFFLPHRARRRGSSSSHPGPHRSTDLSPHHQAKSFSARSFVAANVDAAAAAGTAVAAVVAPCTCQPKAGLKGGRVPSHRLVAGIAMQQVEF